MRILDSHQVHRSLSSSLMSTLRWSQSCCSSLGPPFSVRLSVTCIVVNGIISFNDNAVYVSTPGLNLKKVTGDVAFNNAEVSGTQINANLFEQPLTFDFATEPTNTGDLALTVDLAGQWDLDTLPDYI